MSNRNYEAYWALKIDSIIEELKSGKSIVEMSIKDIDSDKRRKDYYANFKILRGEITADSSPLYRKGRRIHTRDFVRVLKEDAYYREQLFERELRIQITKPEIKLIIEILRVG